jgi:hypothetical protein
MVASGTSASLAQVIFPSGPSQGYAIGDQGAAIQTTDAGLNWSPLPAPPVAFVNFVAIAAPPGGTAPHLYIAGDDGAILKFAISGVAEQRPMAAAGHRTPELTVSPNPARGMVLVSYSLPVAGTATLRLYDRTGRCVGNARPATPAAGSTNGVQRLDLAGLASGVYFVEITSREASAVARLIVTR